MASKDIGKQSMKDVLDKDGGGHNDGIVMEKGLRGQQFVRSFGLDRSTNVGTVEEERATARGMAGGVENVSHSLGGATANQTGRSRG